MLILFDPPFCCVSSVFWVSLISMLSSSVLNSSCISLLQVARYCVRCSLMWGGRSFVGMLWSFWWWTRTFAGKPSRIHWWRIAWSGVIRFFGSHSRHFYHKLDSIWIFTYLNEIYKACIFTFKHIFKYLSSRFPNFSLRVLDQIRHIVLIEKFGLALALRQNFAWRDAYHFHDKTELIYFVFTWENWVTHCEFRHNTAKTPHINTWSVRNAKNDFRCTIEPTLNICIHSFILEARRPKVNNFNTRLRWVFEQYVLRFKITMNYIILFQIFKRVKQLNCKSTDKT